MDAERVAENLVRGVGPVWAARMDPADLAPIVTGSIACLGQGHVAARSARPRPRTGKAQRRAGILFAEGRLALPLSEARRAHELLERSAAKGKLVLVP